MNILRSVIDKVKNFDDKTRKILIKGFFFSFLLCLISTTTLFTYQFLYSFPLLFYVGISLFRTSLMFAVSFFICAIGFDTIKREMI